MLAIQPLIMTFHFHFTKLMKMLTTSLRHTYTTDMKRLLFLMLSFVISSKMQSQVIEITTTTVRGVVIDKQSQFPIPGATIVLMDSDPVKGTASDIDGNFRLEEVPVGRQSIQVVMIGYEPLVFTNLLLNSGKELTLNVQLIESVAELKAVEISAQNSKSESITPARGACGAQPKSC